MVREAEIVFGAKGSKRGGREEILIGVGILAHDSETRCLAMALVRP